MKASFSLSASRASASLSRADVELRVPLGLGESIYDTVFRKGTHEYVAIGLVSNEKIRNRDVLFVRRVFELPESAYYRDNRHGASWSGSAMIPAISAGMDQALGLVLLHAHDHDGPPHLSDDDSSTAARLVPTFRARVPLRPHGAIVLSRTHASGVVLMPGEDTPRTTIHIRWYGASVRDFKSSLSNSAPGELTDFARQLLVVRGDGQRALASARVAIVGLGGGGSHVAQQLAHLGVGEIVCIDDDRASRTDRHRLIGLTRPDIWLRRRKTSIIRRIVNKVGLSRRCYSVAGRVPEPRSLEAIKGADVIVGCLDNLHARADLQELAWRFLIPYVDIGVSIRAIDSAGMDDASVTIGGNVITLIPGGFCMWCCGFLSKERLDGELAGPNRSYFQDGAGEAQVVSLNGLVASQAVTEVLQLLTGFGGASIRRSGVALPDQPTLQRGFRKFDGVRGTLQDWGAARRDDCDFCNSSLGAGVPAWSRASKIKTGAEATTGGQPVLPRATSMTSTSDG
jgi:hypothetical protein